MMESCETAPPTDEDAVLVISGKIPVGIKAGSEVPRLMLNASSTWCPTCVVHRVSVPPRREGDTLPGHSRWRMSSSLYRSWHSQWNAGCRASDRSSAHDAVASCLVPSDRPALGPGVREDAAVTLAARLNDGNGGARGACPRGPGLRCSRCERCLLLCSSLLGIYSTLGACSNL